MCKVFSGKLLSFVADVQFDDQSSFWVSITIYSEYGGLSRCFYAYNILQVVVPLLLISCLALVLDKYSTVIMAILFLIIFDHMEIMIMCNNFVCYEYITYA
jgi:hypothetical protein